MNSNRSNRSLVRRSGFTRSGFTMVEMIVTIGILMVVTAGIATIFSSVGDTVSKGRKLSELNQFAARVERIMREDFEAMTRDGFLVIVNRNANFGRDVQLFRGEQTNIDENLFGGFSNMPGRIRRSDEIMFFTRGEYETARRAISPDMIARSSEAAIYYGHGQKRRPQLTGFNGINNFFFNPAPWDSNFDFESGFNQAGVGVTSTAGALNPNEFARDWSLLRQVTLLSTPIGESRNVPRELFGYSRGVAGQRDWLMDSDRQIALQPASRSIFNSLGWSDPSRVLPGSTDPIRWLGDNAINQLNLRELPQYRASGLVDIVTEDIATIRTMIQSLPVKVSPLDYSFFDAGSGFGMNVGADGVILNRDQFEFDYWATASDADAVIPDPKDADELNLTGSAAHRANIRRWMIDALPSRWDTSVTPPEHLAGVRYEDIPTRIMYPESQFEVSDRGDLQRAYAEAHQEMLGSSIFVPRCTEFIVEWSYGFLQDLSNPASPNYKEMIWYGLDRYVDSNNDGVLSSGGTNPDQRAAVPYSQRVLVGAAATDPATGRPRNLGMDPNLVVGVNRLPVLGGPPPLSPDSVEIATFGFMDPRGTPAVDDDVEWLWPKFIRITMSLGDPTDPEIEQTYQVIFELPERE